AFVLSAVEPPPAPPHAPRAKHAEISTECDHPELMNDLGSFAMRRSAAGARARHKMRATPGTAANGADQRLGRAKACERDAVRRGAAGKPAAVARPAAAQNRYGITSVWISGRGMPGFIDVSRRLPVAPLSE